MFTLIIFLFCNKQFRMHVSSWHLQKSIKNIFADTTYPKSKWKCSASLDLDVHLDKFVHTIRPLSWRYLKNIQLMHVLYLFFANHTYKTTIQRWLIFFSANFLWFTHIIIVCQVVKEMAKKLGMMWPGEFRKSNRSRIVLRQKNQRYVASR